MNIYPSILETDISSFKQQMTYLSSIFSYTQIDIADGIFVQNKTIQLEDILEMITDDPKHIAEYKVEFHLMVKDYKKEIEKLEQLSKFWNIKKILIHLSTIQNTFILDLGSNKWPFGVVINPEDDVESNIKLIKEFTTVQIMTVHPGYQGLPFLESQLNKINQLRLMGYTGEILLDGGINEKTFPLILKNKYLPDAVCPGSYFRTDAEKKLKILKAATRELEDSGA